MIINILQIKGSKSIIKLEKRTFSQNNWFENKGIDKNELYGGSIH